MRAILFTLVLTVVGCSADDLLDDLPDASADSADSAPLPEGDFSCLDQPRPDTAPDPLTLSGVIRDGSGSNIAGVTVEILDATDMTVLASGISRNSPAPDQRGYYSLDVATGGTAPLLIRKVTQLGRVDSYWFDAAPVTAQLASAQLFSMTAELRDNYTESLGYTPDPSAGQLWVIVLDCAAQPVSGATISVPGAEGIGYVSEEGQVGAGTGQTETASSGQAVAINTPPGMVDVTVTVGGITYRSWPVLVVANSSTDSPRLP